MRTIPKTAMGFGVLTDAVLRDGWWPTDPEARFLWGIGRNEGRDQRRLYTWLFGQMVPQ